MTIVQSLQNRMVLRRVVLKIAFVFLFASGRSPLAEAMEQLLSLCALFSAGSAVILRERWAPSVMTRWDEAAFFLFVSCGIHVFAGS